MTTSQLNYKNTHCKRDIGALTEEVITETAHITTSRDNSTTLIAKKTEVSSVPWASTPLTSAHGTLAPSPSASCSYTLTRGKVKSLEDML